MRTVSLQRLQELLVEAERRASVSEEPGDQEMAARGRRWLEVSGDESDFAAIATELGGYVRRDGEPWQWARVAGLWHLAGDEKQAHAWARRVVRARLRTVDPGVRAGAFYLLDDLRKVERTKADAAAVWLAEIARSKDLAVTTEVRERLVRLAAHGGGLPQDGSVGTPLTPWDWVEESFRLEARLTGRPVPSHEAMLRAAGVLTDAASSQKSPEPLSPTVDARADLASGAWLDVKEPGYVEIFIPPTLTVVLREAFERWGAWLPDAPLSSGEWIVEAEFVHWRHAGVEAADWVGISGRPRETAAAQERDIRSLLAAAGGKAGPPVATPREVPPASDDNLGLPTITSEYSGIIEIALTDDLVAELREYEDGWNARVAPDRMTMMQVAVPPSAATWQDAALALATWLTDHRGGHGVPELRSLLEGEPEF